MNKGPNPRIKQNQGLRASIAVYGGRIVMAILQAAALVLLAREVVPAELGVVSVAVSIVSFIGLFADFGFGTSASRTLARGDEEKTRLLVTFHNLFLAFTTVIIALGVYMAFLLNVPHVTLAFFLLALWIFIERNNSVRVSLAIASGQALKASSSMAQSRIVAIFIYYILLNKSSFSATTSYFCFLILSALLSTIMLRRVMPTRAPIRPEGRLSEHFREARPFWLASVSGQARTMDNVVLSAMAGATAAGLYAFPARAVGPLRLIATSLGAVAMPAAARAEWGEVKTLERGMWVLSSLFGVITLILWVIGEPLLTWLLGSEYGAAAPVLSILMLGVAVNIPGALWSSILQGGGEEKVVARIGIALIPAYYIFIVLGIYFWGVNGAAWGVTGTFCLQFIIMLILRVRKEWPGKNECSNWYSDL